MAIKRAFHNDIEIEKVIKIAIGFDYIGMIYVELQFELSD